MSGDKLCIVQFDNRFPATPESTLDPKFQSQFDLAEYTRKTCEASDDCKYFRSTSNEAESEKPPYWEKVDRVREVVENGECKYTMWLDTDATITNTPTYIKKYLDFRFGVDDNRGIVVSSDKGDKPSSDFNAGVFAVNNNDAGKSIMKEWSDKGWKNSKNQWEKNDGKWESSDGWAGSAYEQGYFLFNYMKHLEDGTPIDDSRVDPVNWCVLQRNRGGDEERVCRHQDVSIAVHFAGSGNKGRIATFLEGKSQ